MMRTTITLDDDTAELVRAQMERRGAGLKQVVNDALREALAPAATRRSVRTPTYAMGEPALPLDRALSLAAELEVDELLRKIARRS
jgi:hypothetical protein